jgi:hypothetical protein
VHALLGGLDAWKKAGGPVAATGDSVTVAASAPAGGEADRAATDATVRESVR